MKNIKGNKPAIGTENYKMKDCPFHLPKENLKSFEMFRKAANQAPYNTNTTEYQNQLK